MTDAASIVWRVPVTVDHIPDTGLHREIEASAAVCAGVAALAGVRAVSALSAVLDVVREGPKVHVTGRVRARVGQSCVVTLEPLETDVDEPVDVTFALESAGGTALASAGEGRKRKTDDEELEPLVGGTVDLGAIATEFFILGIDPYPRRARVEFTPPKVEDDHPHPFAALEVLKKRPGGGDA